MEKSPDAFRTISEVAEHLSTPAHVLRFWETRFPQIRPIKRAGGRRYYRPSDVALLAGIKRLLHEDGLTIRGVQKVLREQGVRHVATLGDPAAAHFGREADIEAVLVAERGTGAPDSPDAPQPPEAQGAQVIHLEQALARAEARQAAAGAETARASKASVAPAETPVAKDPVAEVPFVEAADPEPGRALPPPSAPASLAAEMPGPAGAAAPEGTQAADAEEGAGDTPRPPVAARLRATDPARLAGRRAELVALRDRLAELHAQLAKGVKRRAK